MRERERERESCREGEREKERDERVSAKGRRGEGSVFARLCCQVPPHFLSKLVRMNFTLDKGSSSYFETFLPKNLNLKIVFFKKNIEENLNWQICLITYTEGIPDLRKVKIGNFQIRIHSVYVKEIFVTLTFFKNLDLKYNER